MNGQVEPDGELQPLLAGIAPECHSNETRHTCFLALKALAAGHPARLLPEWDTLVQRLAHPNSHIRFIAVHLVAELACAAPEAPFEAAFRAFFDRLGDEKITVSGQAAILAGRLALAHPGQVDDITTELLSLEQGTPLPGSRELLKAYAIESLDAFYHLSTRQPELLEFARRQMQSPSPRARNAARVFLKKRAPGLV